jgi:signal transduction histidine kinase/CheY-like chemotaxis protein
VFKHLRTKLTVLYAALFVAALALVALAVSATATNDVERIGRDELTTSGEVFDNLLSLRIEGLLNEAEVLAHDFGFRAAVATGDRATITSALDNLASRRDLNMAFVVDLKGRVTARDDRVAAALPADMIRAVRADGPVSGVFHIKGIAYEAVATPILTPEPAGWMVFAKAVGRPDMARLERLSAIPLHAAVLVQWRDGLWRGLDGQPAALSGPVFQRQVARAFAAAQPAPFRIGGAGGASLVLARRLAGLGEGQRAVLVLRYPFADALRPFHALIASIAAIGVAAVLMLVVGTWLIARTVTQPIQALEDAARRLQHGETVRVTIRSDDEIARLGSTFNAMADGIVEREARLKQARDLAQAADRAKGEFLANMNHEFRTPLNGVLGAASVLAGAGLAPEQARLVRMIETSGESLERMVDKVLDMVELGAGQIELMDEPFDLYALVRRLAKPAAVVAEAKGLAFAYDLPQAGDGWVRGDRRRLGQILSNLIDNAVKFTERGEVSVKLARTDGGWRFEVRDTGVGFDPSEADQVFQPFRQGDGSMTRRFGGVGLGLSLARRVARAMGGDISAEGARGRGACFTLLAPLAAVRASNPPNPTTLAEAGTRAAGEPEEARVEASPRVLMAEDHLVNRKVVELILGAAGVELLTVENGAEAVALFQAQAFDAVLMDLQMPVMDGLTAIRHIREWERQAERPRTPIVVLSANVQVEHLKASAAAGADNHLSKPLSAPVLLAALETVLHPPMAPA